MNQALSEQYDSVIALLEQFQLVSATNRTEPEEEGITDIMLDDLKARAIRDVQKQKEYEKYELEKQNARKSKTDTSMQTSHNMIFCTKPFLDFTKTELCDNMILATIFYVSSTLYLEGHGPHLSAAQVAHQESVQADSMRLLSSLYCQLLLLPSSSSMKVREERVFFETLICFLDSCACSATHTENRELIYKIVARVFRKGMQDPRARHKSEFLPITEIVRRNWLSQRVPGKTRAEIQHNALKGTTDLIEVMCQRELPATNRGMPSSTDIWSKTGMPKNSLIPIGEKVISRDLIIDLTPPKNESSQPSKVPTRAISPRGP